MKTLTTKDFNIDWFSGQGSGGQHRNKHQNCCRITHLETGLRAQSSNHKDRPSNQRDAFNRLAAKLIAYYSEPETENRAPNRVVRTYHFERNTVTDGQLEKQISSVMDSDLDEFVEAALTGQRPNRKTGRM